MNERLRAASIEWLSLTIQREKPGEPQPRQLAEELHQIAYDQDVPIEDVVKWIAHHEGEISTRQFAYWAVAYDTVRQMQRWPHACGHCGAVLNSADEARAHKCGEQP